MKRNIIIVMVLSFLGTIILSAANAEDLTIEMLNKRDDGAKMVYGTDIARVEVGTTITWIPTQKGHNVEFIAGPDGWKAPKKSKVNKEVSITFDTPGVYLYQCTPHATMGMIALVVVGDGDNDVSKAKVRGKSKRKLKELLKEL
jgi:pseudoazurin